MFFGKYTGLQSQLWKSQKLIRQNKSHKTDKHGVIKVSGHYNFARKIRRYKVDLYMDSLILNTFNREDCIQTICLYINGIH